MMTWTVAIQTIFTGLAIASIWYWLLTIKRQNRTREDFKWWLKHIVPQAIVITIAAKLLHIF